MNERRIYDLENRLIDFTVRIIKLAEIITQNRDW